MQIPEEMLQWRVLGLEGASWASYQEERGSPEEAFLEVAEACQEVAEAYLVAVEACPGMVVASLVGKPCREEEEAFPSSMEATSSVETAFQQEVHQPVALGLLRQKGLDLGSVVWYRIREEGKLLTLETGK
jgi:hypothetical protein